MQRWELPPVSEFVRRNSPFITALGTPLLILAIAWAGSYLREQNDTTVRLVTEVSLMSDRMDALQKSISNLQTKDAAHRSELWISNRVDRLIENDNDLRVRVRALETQVPVNP